MGFLEPFRKSHKLYYIFIKLYYICPIEILLYGNRLCII